MADDVVERFKDAALELFLRRKFEGPLPDGEEARIASEHMKLWDELPESARDAVEMWIDEHKDALLRVSYFKTSDIGRVGVDNSGMRFMVLSGMLFMVLRPIWWSEGESISNVAVLPGTRVRLPGTILHHSWVDLPIRWEET